MSTKVPKTTKTSHSPITGYKGTCEDCRWSIPSGPKGVGILTCRNKEDGAGRMWIVDRNGSCPNFNKDRELLAPELVRALAEGAKLMPLTQDKYAILDVEDYEVLSTYKWYAKKGGGTYYATRAVRLYKDDEYVGVRQVLMHRVITNAPPGMMVDHINHNGLDNRKSNLRLCTRRQNAQNSRPRTGTSSRYKGVIREKATNRFRVRIRHNGKRLNLGTFKNEKNAAEAYDKKATELFGEFACLNFP